MIRINTYKLLLLMVFCFCPLTTVFAADEGRITDIRFWQSPEEAQVVLDISAQPRVSPVSQLKDGTLFFDINHCVFRPGRQRYPLKNPFLEVLTVQQTSEGRVRVFFRVPVGVEAKTFVLPVTASKGDRIVIFLKEPRAQLIKRRNAELNEVNRLKAENVKIIVLDPGHGGEDPGARHNGIIEKNYVMTMGKLIKAYFDRDPRFKAVLTRDGDYIIPLQRRREIAEHLGADAFISLHVNYNSRKSIRGFEVYYESPRGAVGEAERIVAEMENQVDFGGDTPTNSSLEVKRDIVERQAAIMNKSRQFANRIEMQLGATVVELPSRGVKRAGFKVLHSMAMPSVLVEFGYTSNLQDVAVVKNYNSRTRMAQGVYLGVRDFLLNPIEEGLDTSYLAYIKTSEAKKKTLAQRRKAAQAKKAANKKKASKYKVKSGDTLSQIASRYKIPLARLLNLNNITSKHVIKVGDTLLIPAK